MKIEYEQYNLLSGSEASRRMYPFLHICFNYRMKLVCVALPDDQLLIPGVNDKNPYLNEKILSVKYSGCTFDTEYKIK